MKRLKLIPADRRVYRVFNETGLHVGNLKWIRGQWKFKALGYDDCGRVVPGGGPLTERHNTMFEAPDEATLTHVLLFSTDTAAAAEPGPGDGHA